MTWLEDLLMASSSKEDAESQASKTQTKVTGEVIEGSRTPSSNDGHGIEPVTLTEEDVRSVNSIHQLFKHSQS